MIWLFARNFFKNAKGELMPEIIIRGLRVLIDDEDYERVTQLPWRILYDKNGYCRIASGSKSIPLGRFILGLSKQDKRVADHINGNVLDNRRSNLRAVSKQNNILNSDRCRNASLISVNGFGYQVRAGHGGCIYIGSYKTREEAVEAARRYKQAREK